MKKLLIVATTAVVLAYLFYCPLPDGIADRFYVRFLYAERKISKFVAKSSVFLGLNDPVGVLRAIPRLKTWRVTRGCDGEPTIVHSDTTFDGVNVRVYEPVVKSEKPIPGMVYIHGGGWTILSTDSYHYLTRYMAARLGIVLVSVDYRLSPEHPFPAPIEDCIKATVCFLQHAKDYNVDPTRIAVVGDSAGGNFAAATAGLLTFDDRYQDMGLPKLKFQGLIYPALQALDFLTPSYHHGDIFLLTQDIMTKFWSWYLTGDLRYAEAMKTNNHTCPHVKKKHGLDYSLIPDKFIQNGYNPQRSQVGGSPEICENICETLLNPDFAPLMRSDLRGLPPAYVLTAEFDVLRDDGILYAKRLEQAGVPVTWKNYESGFHGIFALSVGKAALDVGRQCMNDFIEFCKVNL
ncbi:neutral cholesterol ester hydrolase 1-like [Ptychodera flava]|uniref:neutral cholesterol ester hydrolase 1-like n=1 Tax=Ptychodera flava TaxID=63121 RepID=UPI003969DDA9